MKRNLGIFLIVISTSLMLGCSVERNGQARATLSQGPFATTFVEREALSKVSTVLVLPGEWTPESQACKSHFDADKELVTALQSESRTKVLEPAHSKYTAGNVKAAIADSGADAAVVVKLIRCEERIGSTYGATQPAQIGFLITAFDAAGKNIWTGAFSMKDQAIFDNLLTAREKLKVGAGWVTAGEILSHGMTLAAREFENERTRMFLSQGSGMKTN